MSEHHDHRDDCPFKFATLDVCDCVEKNMLDRIESLSAERDRWKDACRSASRDLNIVVPDNDRLKSERDAAEAKLAKAVEALEAVYEIAVAPAETDHKNVRGWIEVTIRNTIAEIKGESHD